MHSLDKMYTTLVTWESNEMRLAGRIDYLIQGRFAVHCFPLGNVEGFGPLVRLEVKGDTVNLTLEVYSFSFHYPTMEGEE